MADEENKQTDTPKEKKATDNQELVKEPEKKTTDNRELVKQEESLAKFEPVVKLDEVDVNSGEEDEEILYGVRAKLFIFGETLLDVGSGNKTWRERGIGEARILRHKEHQRLRLLMRQEKTMKVIANHVIDPRIQLKTNAGSDRSWVWSAFDFCEGELVETDFAMRFVDSETANTFNDKFVEYQKEMESLLSGEDKLGDDDGASVDKAAEVLSSLNTKDDGKDDQ